MVTINEDISKLMVALEDIIHMALLLTATDYLSAKVLPCVPHDNSPFEIFELSYPNLANIKCVR